MNEITPHTEGGDELSSDLPNDNETTWENNHIVITNYITHYISEYWVMPSKTAIAKHTGLSRDTVHRHLKTYSETALQPSQ